MELILINKQENCSWQIMLEKLTWMQQPVDITCLTISSPTCFVLSSLRLSEWEVFKDQLKHKQIFKSKWSLADVMQSIISWKMSMKLFAEELICYSYNMLLLVSLKQSCSQFDKLSTVGHQHQWWPLPDSFVICGSPIH